MIVTMHKFAAIIALLALLAALNGGVTAAFTHSPESAAEYLGAQATFTCITDGSHFLFWTVNGVEARFPEVRNKGITFVHSGVNSEASNLTVLASLQNNNSEIICIQQNLITGQEIARTSPVYLYVQGLLDPPSEITVDFKNETIIHLTWLPPFSLKNITGYVVTISMESDSERIINELQTTLSEFTYTWRLSFGYCQNSFIFQIATVNNLGTGNKTSGVVAGFLRSFVESSPSSQIARPGEWVNFTCGIQCSEVDLVAWFLNDSTLSLFQDTDLNFQRYPQHSYCGTSQIIGIENHTLSLMTNYDFGFPLMVDCVLISGCGAAVEECISYTCSSESARFELQGMSTQETHFQDTAASNAPDLKMHILFGTSLGLGALLLILLTLFITTVILMLYCHRNKRNSILERESKIQEPIYETPAAVIIQPNSCATAINELEMENYPDLDEAMSPGPTTLQHCPAYEAASCIKRP